MDILRQITTVGFLLSVVNGVASEAVLFQQLSNNRGGNALSQTPIFQHLSNDMGKRIKDLFYEDRKLCELLQKSSELLWAQETEAQRYEETLPLTETLKTNLKNENAAFGRVRAGITPTKSPTDRKAYLVKEAKHEKQTEKFEDELKVCADLHGIYETARGIRCNEYIKLQERKAAQKSTNDKLFQSTVESWTAELTSIDGFFYSLVYLRITDGSFRYDADPIDLRSSAVKEYTSTLEDTEAVIYEADLMYNEMMARLSPESTKALSPTTVTQLKYTEVSEEVANYNTNRTVIENKPETAIGAEYPAYKTCSLQCNSPVRIELLTALVIERAVKQGQQRIAFLGSNVSWDFFVALKKQLEVIKKDMMENPVCDFTKRGLTKADLKRELNKLSEKYKTKANDHITALGTVAVNGDPNAIYQATQNIEKLKKEFEREFHKLRGSLRDARDCIKAATKLERLIYENPLPQWQQQIRNDGKVTLEFTKPQVFS